MTVIQPDVESFRKPVLAALPAKFEGKWGKGLWEKHRRGLTGWQARDARRRAGTANLPRDRHALPRSADSTRAAAIVACALVAALLVCVALGVVTRGLGDPLIWTDELSRFLMVWLAVFGWILASRKRIHVRIRYFQDLLPQRAHAGGRTVPAVRR